MQGGLTGAQNSTGAALTSQQNQLDAYKSTAANAAQVMQGAQQAMNNIETLAQQQGTMNANQQQAYAAAKQAYAAASLAGAQAAYAMSQTTGQNQQNQDFASLMKNGISPSTGKAYVQPSAPTANASKNQQPSSLGSTLSGVGNWLGIPQALQSWGSTINNNNKSANGNPLMGGLLTSLGRGTFW